MRFLWPLRSWIDPIIKRRKSPEFTFETAFADDTAESEAALALRRPLVKEHWAWGSRVFFAVRSRMMATVN